MDGGEEAYWVMGHPKDEVKLVAAPEARYDALLGQIFK